jgi:hypothetical protein
MKKSLTDVWEPVNTLKFQVFASARRAAESGNKALATDLDMVGDLLRFTAVCLCSRERTAEAVEVLKAAANRDVPGRPGYWSRLWSAILGR